MRVGCVGMTTIDTLLFVSDIPKDDDALRVAQKVVTCIGGKGMVTAISIHSLGGETHLLSLVGNSKEAVAEVTEQVPYGMTTDFLIPCLPDNHRTWITISVDQSVTTIVHPMVPGTTAGSLIRARVHRLISDTDLLYVTAENIDYTELLSLAQERTLPVVTNLNAAFSLDPKNRVKLREIVDSSHTLIMNSGEASLVPKAIGISSWSELGGQVKEIIITSGVKGGHFSTYPFRSWESYDAWAQLEAKCVVGAGDTFNGAYLKARFFDRASLASSCAFAAEVAGRKVGFERSYI